MNITKEKMCLVMSPVIYGKELQVATSSNFFSLHLSHNSHLPHLASPQKHLAIKKKEKEKGTPGCNFFQTFSHSISATPHTFTAPGISSKTFSNLKKRKKRSPVATFFKPFLTPSEQQLTRTTPDVLWKTKNH